jgi:hypothetical protein
VDYVERLVVQAETKLERQKRACASQESKLEVRLLLSLFQIFFADLSIFSQARNVTLLRTEREAYETVRCNNISMRKVDAFLHTPGSVQTVTARTGSARTGSVRTGSVWPGPVRTSSVRTGSVRTGPLRLGPVRFGPVRFGPFRFGPVRTGSVRTGSVRTGPL